jgi:hypothetical protein
MWTPLKRPERANRFQQTLDREAEERVERVMRERGQLPAGNYPFFRDPTVLSHAPLGRTWRAKWSDGDFTASASKNNNGAS